jgi:type IV pilus assembly protein PilC
MAEFVCKVADASGRIFEQIETAQSEGEARQSLADRGLFVYRVRPQRALALGGLRATRSRALRSSDFLVFNQQFNTLIKAGLPILKALELLAERAAAPRLRPLLQRIRQQVREGALLSEAIQAQGVFPGVYTTAILAGEKSGNLSEVLEQYITYQRVMGGMRKRLLSVLVYPTILVIVATTIVSYLALYVIPQFAKLYADLGVPLPGPTRLLIALVMGYRNYVLGIVIALVLLAIGIFLWSRTVQGGIEFDRMKLRLPVVGETWIKFQVARFVRTLGTLLAGGTPLVAALETAAGSLSSRLVSNSAREAARRVREGESLHASLAVGRIVPDLALEMIEVGEASGALAPMLTSVAEFYEEDVNLRTQTLISIVEPLILVVMAAVVLFILISLYLPLFSFSIGNVG